MRTYEEAWAAAREGSPFSNGTEGFAWEENWCARCVHDAEFRRTGDGSGCVLMQVALLGRTPVEWIDQTANGHRLGDTYQCTEFRDKDDNGGGEGEPDPGPPPVIDGQVDMFEVFADQITAQASREAVPA